MPGCQCNCRCDWSRSTIKTKIENKLLNFLVVRRGMANGTRGRASQTSVRRLVAKWGDSEQQMWLSHVWFRREVLVQPMVYKAQSKSLVQRNSDLFKLERTINVWQERQIRRLEISSKRLYWCHEITIALLVLECNNKEIWGETANNASV